MIASTIHIPAPAGDELSGSQQRGGRVLRNGRRLLPGNAEGAFETLSYGDRYEAARIVDITLSWDF